MGLFQIIEALIYFYIHSSFILTDFVILYSVITARPTPSLPRSSMHMCFRPGYLSDQYKINGPLVPFQMLEALIHFIFTLRLVLQTIFFYSIIYNTYSFIFYNILHSGLLYNVYIGNICDIFTIQYHTFFKNLLLDILCA
jgi:hypothetical protein